MSTVVEMLMKNNEHLSQLTLIMPRPPAGTSKMPFSKKYLVWASFFMCLWLFLPIGQIPLSAGMPLYTVMHVNQVQQGARREKNFEEKV